MKKKNVDIDALISFYPRLQAREITQAQVAAHFGVTRETLRAIAKRSGHPLPAVKSAHSLATRLLERYTRDQLSEMTQYQLAEDFRTTQPNVCIALRELRIKSNGGCRKERSDAKCQLVIDHIIEHGGWVKPTIEKLGISLDKGYVYRYARKEGIGLRKYGMAYRTYGHWITQPCHPKRVGPADHILLAQCQLCGNTYEVMRINLVSGASTCCRHCSQGCTGGHHKVRCVETGEVFRSIRSWATSVEGPRRYQALRLKLNRTGRLVLKDKTYELIVTEDS